MPKCTPSTCPTCGKATKLRPSQASKRKFCNVDCQKMHVSSWFGYVHANIHAQTCQEMADHIGVPKNTMRTWLFNMRSWGWKLPYFDLRLSQERSPAAQALWAEMALSKAQRMESIGIEKARLKAERLEICRKVRMSKPTKQKESPSNHGRPPKKPPEQFKNKTIPIDAEGYTWVRVNSKTIVQRKIAV